MKTLYRTVASIPTIWLFAIVCSLVTSFGSMAARGDDVIARPSVGLVLSGGGARGAAHVGVFKLLADLKIPIDYVAGTSMGAIVGGLIASGMSAEELELAFDSADWPMLLSDRPPRAQRSYRRKSDDIGFLVDFEFGIDKSGIRLPEGLVQGQNLEIELKRLTMPVVSISDFDRLPVPFRAVATDIVTGEPIVLQSGDLASTLRASMSAPGIFKPQRRKGQRLVDGGIVNNLPIDVVRNMGADVLIVVDVGFPLLSEDQLNSLPALTHQMLTILINRRSKEQIKKLAAQDILISPELGNIGSQDFHRAAEAKELGNKKALEMIKMLSKFSVSEHDYQLYRQGVEAKRRDIPIIDSISIENNSKLSSSVIESHISQQSDERVNINQLEADISDLYGFGTFETVSYDVVESVHGTELKINTSKKSWGPNYLRLGANLEDDFKGNSVYNIAARLTYTELNKLGGELRTEFQLGDTPRILAEYYQPLGYRSLWFASPHVELISSNSGLFDSSGAQLAQIGSDSVRLSMEGGRRFGNWGAVRLGITRVDTDVDVRIGIPNSLEDSVQTTSLTARVEFDTIDNFAVPRFGSSMQLEWVAPRESLGSEITSDIATLNFLRPSTWGDHTLLQWLSLGSTVKKSNSMVEPFKLGGLFNLSGYAPNEISGIHFGIARSLYYHRLNEPDESFLNTQFYLGGSVEVGNAWQNSDDISLNNSIVSGSVFVVLETLIGPFYLAYGASEGGRRSAYLYFGQTF